MNKDNEDYIIFDPSRDEILGVFGNLIHIQSDNCILQIPLEEYFRVWNIWIEGKRDYCERYNHYCGVMGYTKALKYKKLSQLTEILVYFEEDEEPTTANLDTYLVEKFEDICDFEHG